MSIFLPILSFLVTESWVCPSHGSNESARRVSENKKDRCNPMDCSLLGSFVHGIFQARILEYVAISSSRGSSQPKDWTHISCVFCIAGRFFTCWTIREAHLFLNKVLKNIVHGQSKPQGWAQHPRDGGSRLSWRGKNVKITHKGAAQGRKKHWGERCNPPCFPDG